MDDNIKKFMADAFDGDDDDTLGENAAHWVTNPKTKASEAAFDTAAALKKTEDQEAEEETERTPARAKKSKKTLSGASSVEIGANRRLKGPKQREKGGFFDFLIEELGGIFCEKSNSAGNGASPAPSAPPNVPPPTQEKE